MIKPNKYVKIWKGHEALGVTYNQVKASHTAKEFKNFCRWMSGQTGGVGDNGLSYIYSSDYERWCRQGLKTTQNAEDWD